MVGRSVRTAILAIEGTNCDEELARALRTVGGRPEVIHLKRFGRDEGRRRRRLSEFDLLFFPGGFSAGDYVRAGAIFAARVRTTLGDDLEEFVRDGRLVGGVCNGFQTLIELGLLPGRADGRLGPPEAALMPNDSGHFECRPTYCAWPGGTFAPLREVPVGTSYLFPSAHAEGKLVLPGPPGERLRALEANGQILFRWAAPDGGPPVYPWNPNGSEGDVAGLTN
ncbi:phosphoribosylformylglycinamidine synthase I, partial [mine drainage metagenome]